MELAVNMPEHDPHVGHADRSMVAISASATLSSTALIIASIRSRRRGLDATPSSPMTAVPASMGPPDTKTAGMFRRSAASSMPGVILSQFEMHTSASAWWALHMYSTESAMISRLGRL